MVEAFQQLHSFKTSTPVEDDEGEILTAKSGWMEEAIGWIDTFEKVTQRKVTGDLVFSKQIDFSSAYN